MYRLRLQSPLGFYPPTPVSIGAEAKLLFDGGLAFSVVKAQSPEIHGLANEHFSELEFLSLEEIRFFSAVSMAHHPEQGAVYLYPLPVFVSLDALPPDDAHLFQFARQHLNEIPEKTWNARSMVVPGSCVYEHHATKLDSNIVSGLVRQIKLSDHLLMRGLGSLVNAQMLAQRLEFVEAAVMMLFVALEVSFQLICRVLRKRGNQNPTAADASAYLEAELGFDFRGQTEGYFLEWYEARIKALHPVNRFGTFAFPPLEHDDYYFLRSSMMVVFTYLISGHKWRFSEPWEDEEGGRG